MGLKDFFSGIKENSIPSNESQLDCPKCKQRMIKKTRQNVTIDKCIKCGGAWLDKGEIFKILGKISDNKSRELAAERLKRDGD